MDARTYAATVGSAFRQAGLVPDECLSATYDARSFGNAAVVFRVGCMRLKVVKDRGEEFIDVAGSSEGDRFHSIIDVGVALGWLSTHELLSQGTVEPLPHALQRVAEHWSELSIAMAPERLPTTEAAVRQAMEERARLMRTKLGVGVEKGTKD